MASSDKENGELTFRAPTSADGSDVWNLIRESGPLDENSMYCNTLQCDHFGETCVIAELNGKIVGWVSAFIMPSDPESLFIWQVAVDSDARGMGVAGKMLDHLLKRDACAGVTRLQTTITADNDASWALFNSFAEKMDAPLERDPHYKRDTHFEGRHATEYMVTIGDFEPAASQGGNPAA
ncbi:MAG: diaminobutyrate acetyltransferase [Paracoccaceae bacterium]